MNVTIILAPLVLLAALACNQKNSDPGAANPALLDKRIPSVSDGSSPVSVPGGLSGDAVPVATPAAVAGSCQTFDGQGAVSSCVDYPQSVYAADAAQGNCNQTNPNNKFTAGQACTHDRASGGCVSSASSTTTWFYLAPNESPGARPAPACDDGQQATPP